jgi:Glycosyl transferase family 2
MRSRRFFERPVIAVPAKNEAERLPTLLRTLALQTWLSSSDRPLDVVVVLNNCSDRSAEVVRVAASLHPGLLVNIVEVDFPGLSAHVGSARRLAMQRAQDICGPRAVLFSTDADATPAKDWVEASLRAIHAGADIVGGHIVGDKIEEKLLGPGFNRRAARHLQYAKLVDRFKSLIHPVAHDPWPRHSDHTGASIAVRAGVYRAVGGMPALPFREDVAFIANAVAAGYRLRHAPDVQVGVSARLDGRASGGMADCLKAWLAAEAAGLADVVESPESLCYQLAGRAREATIGLASPSTRSKTAWLRRTLERLGLKRFRPTTTIETAIQELTEMIADTENVLRVA